LELRVQDKQNALSPERAAQTVEYWRAAMETLNPGQGATDSLYPRMAYTKMASEQAEFLLNRGYPAEAEQTLRLANEMGAGSPEAFYRLVNLLVSQGRINDALAAAEATYQNLPSAERMKTYYGENPAPPGQMRAVIENLKRMQNAK
jgi:tetratricopeptide (TPR) repeat protein